MKRSKWQRFLIEEDAATAVEYAILLGVIGLAVIKSCQVLGVEMNLTFQSATDAMNNATR
jgi:Flp pilus assembly pilin Flp